ncbi:MAG: SigE family RNA polymerase sigma factor [Mycobacteriales bacterium]|nr:SigE family RNA polymerase sigma factor [Frankia sp.]
MRTAREEEFRAFVEAHRAGLVRTATLLAAGDGHLAEDLVQTSLTRLYLAWPRVRRRDGPLPYVHRILINAFTDETRRPAWRRERAQAELPDVAVEGATPAEERDEVRRALAALPPGMRAAVVLRHWLELDTAETAAALGCSEGNVKSQTARGLERLRELLSAPPAPATGAAPTNVPQRSQP